MSSEAPVHSTLRLREVSYVTSSRPLLNKVSLDIPSGSITAIVGQNGAGKSTLLNIVSGDLKATSGDISLQNTALHVFDRSELCKRIAYLPQNNVLNFPFTVREVIRLGRIPHSTGNVIDESIVNAALESMDLVHLSERLYTRLSGGEKQRCQVARVLTQIWREEDAPSRCLLLDEPTSSLDLAHNQKLMSVIKDFSQRGVTVIIVVHDINLAAAHATNIVALKDGSLVAQGHPNEIFTSRNIEHIFDVEMNVFQDPETGRNILLS
ncbi:MAG: heme ABC transporter ATP-binding protein [Agarilytica sp.]